MIRVRTLRDWHRWFAVLVGLFVLFQGLTGAVSQQRFSLLAFSEPTIYAVSQITKAPLSPADVIAVVQIAEPDFRPAHVMLPMTNSQGTAAIIMGGRTPAGLDMSRVITVDQYSGEVIAERLSSDGWVGTVTGWHKWTSFGVSGRIFLTVFGLATIGFMLTGILLWRTSRASTLRTSTLVSVHRGAGVFVSLVLIVVSTTGIAMNLATWQERNTGTSVVASNMRAGMRNPPTGIPQVSLASAWGIATGQVVDQRLAAFSDLGVHAAQYWFAFTDAQLRRTDVLVNPQSGVARVYPAGLLTNVSGVRTWLYSVHTGYVFGAFGGVVMTLIGCALMFWPISGFVMWRRRTRTAASAPR